MLCGITHISHIIGSLIGYRLYLAFLTAAPEGRWKTHFEASADVEARKEVHHYLDSRCDNSSEKLLSLECARAATHKFHMLFSREVRQKRRGEGCTGRSATECRLAGAASCNNMSFRAFFSAAHASRFRSKSQPNVCFWPRLCKNSKRRTASRIVQARANSGR